VGAATNQGVLTKDVERLPNTQTLKDTHVMKKKLHLPSLIAGLLAATLLIYLGSLVSVSIDMIVAYGSVVMMMVLTSYDYLSPSRKHAATK